MSSIVATLARYDESLTVVMTWLSSVGMMLRNACGRTMCHMICTVLKPCEYPASNCPFATAFRPPRTISAMTDDVNRMSAMDALNSCPTSTLERPKCLPVNGLGMKTRQMKIHSSSGVLRKISMYAVASQPKMRVLPLQ